MTEKIKLPQPLFTGPWGNCHIQGICVDEKKGYLYSYTYDEATPFLLTL